MVMGSHVEWPCLMVMGVEWPCPMVMGRWSLNNKWQTRVTPGPTTIE